MEREGRFSFVVDHRVSGRMDRVVIMNDGVVLKKEDRPDGVYYLVART